jgi:dihydroorotase
MTSLVIRNATAFNEGQKLSIDLEIKGDRIHRIAPAGTLSTDGAFIDAEGLWLIPGVIDDQVHFREPGLTHKANIASESQAAVAGGVTSFMEMPNTNPQTTTHAALEDKFAIAAQVSPANYSFFFGATNSNAEEVLSLNDDRVCGVKIFMGSSTGDMLVDKEATLERIFSSCDRLIATHCEDEATIRTRMEQAKERFGEAIPIAQHPIIRNHEACLISSTMASNLAKKHNTRLHILHISTAQEVALFEKGPLDKKRITSEACVHHLWFNDTDYARLGSKIQCNPAIKSEADRKGVWQGLFDDAIDIIATDHAPHTLEEKQKPYPGSPSGLPLVQHTLLMMMQKAIEGEITPEFVVKKMCHAPADCFRLKERGYLREGYYADLVLFDPNTHYTVNAENILYKCAWSPLEGYRFSGSIRQTFVNGVCVYKNGLLTGAKPGMALRFGKQ